MIRLPDWECRLHAFLDSCSAAVFGFDHHLDPSHYDCCMFAAGGVIAVTGEDMAAEFRGRYKSAASSFRALREIGAGNLEMTLDGKFPVRALGFARRGDLILMDGIVGICIGSDALFLRGEDDAPGLIRIPRSDWSKCWGVG